MPAKRTLPNIFLAAGLAVIVAIAFSAKAGATIPAWLQLQPEGIHTLRQIEAYLNSIRTVEAGFVQSSSNGAATSGRLFLSRPGKLRVEYTPPPEVLVVADGTFLIYYDKALDQVSYVPLTATPAGILLEDRIDLEDPTLTITDLQDEAGSAQLSVVRTDKEGEGSLTLIFTTSPWRLSEWEVTDAQGVTTRVTLQEPVFGAALDPKLFNFRNPRLPGEKSYPTGL